MRLSLSSRYALHAVVYIAALKKTEPIASNLIAKARGISDRFLLKVLRPLISARILMSVKGPSGGYRLGKPASEISLLDVIEAVDGPIRGDTPTGQDEKPTYMGKRVEEICNQVAEQTRKTLGKVKISDLASKE